MEVRRDEGAERAEEDDDGNDHGQVVPGFGLGTGVSHELTPVEP